MPTKPGCAYLFRDPPSSFSMWAFWCPTRDATCLFFFSLGFSKASFFSEKKIPRMTLVTCARGREWSYWNCWPSHYDLVVWRSISVFRRKIGIMTLWTGRRDFRNRDSSCDQQDIKLLGFFGCPDFLLYQLIGRVSERWGPPRTMLSPLAKWACICAHRHFVWDPTEEHLHFPYTWLILDSFHRTEEAWHMLMSKLCVLEIQLLPLTNWMMSNQSLPVFPHCKVRWLSVLKIWHRIERVPEHTQV